MEDFSVPDMEIGGAVRRVEPFVDWRAHFRGLFEPRRLAEQARLERLRRLRRPKRWWRTLDVLAQRGFVFALRADGWTFGQIAHEVRDSSRAVRRLYLDAVDAVNAEADRRFP